MLEHSSRLTIELTIEQTIMQAIDRSNNRVFDNTK